MFLQLSIRFSLYLTKRTGIRIAVRRHSMATNREIISHTHTYIRDPTQNIREPRYNISNHASRILGTYPTACLPRSFNHTFFDLFARLLETPVTSSTISHLVIACIARPRLRSTFSRPAGVAVQIIRLRNCQGVRRGRVASRKEGRDVCKSSR